MEQLMGKIDDIITENDEELTKDPNEPRLIDELRLIEKSRHEDSQISDDWKQMTRDYVDYGR